MQVAALQPVTAVRRDPDYEIQVARPCAVAAAAALAAQPDPLPIGDAGWDGHVQIPRPVLAGQRDGPARAVIRLLDRDLDLSRLVSAGNRPPIPATTGAATTGAAAEQPAE